MAIVLLETVHAEALTLLEAYGTVVLLNTPDAVGVVRQTPHVEALITRGRGQIRRELIAALPDLRVVARCGAGLDNIDTVAAAEFGVQVVYAPGSTTTAVAEHTMMLMLSLARWLVPLTTAVRSGNWAIRNGFTSMELAGKTLGIIGMGAIGRRVAQLAEAFGMKVIFWNRTASSDPRQVAALDDLLRSSDVVSVHLALTPQTHHLIGERELLLMKPGALLINTARGTILDQAAVGRATEMNHLAGFASDVLEVEPPPAEEALVASEKVIITPHVAALTAETYRLICVSTVQNVLALLRGEQPEPAALYRTSSGKE